MIERLQQQRYSSFFARPMAAIGFEDAHKSGAQGNDLYLWHE
jgi:hypothetical protein